MLLVSRTNIGEHETVFVVLVVLKAENFSLLYLLSKKGENLATRVEVFDKRTELAHIF